MPAEGESGPEAGRSYRRFRLPGHRATSDVVAGAYPFLAEGGLGSRGVYVGQDAWSGGGYCFDPWVLYRDRVIINPNCLLAGVVGKGKFCLAMSLATRSIAFARRVYVPSDPKGEWSVVAEAVGGAAFQLGGASTDRPNPLDPAPRGASLADAQWHALVTNSRRALVGSLAQSSLGCALRSIKHTALDVALSGAAAETAEPTLPLVVDLLLEQRTSLPGACATDLARDGQRPRARTSPARCWRPQRSLRCPVQDRVRPPVMAVGPVQLWLHSVVPDVGLAEPGRPVGFHPLAEGQSRRSTLPRRPPTLPRLHRSARSLGCVHPW